MSTQLARQWGILRTLHDQKDGLSVKELARRFEVSKNTIARDLDTLLAAGFAVRCSAVGQKQIFTLARGVRGLAQVSVTSLELLALYASRTQLAPLAGTPIYADLMSLLHKLHGAGAGSCCLESVTAIFMEHPRGTKDYGKHEEVVDRLVDAIMRRRRCIAVYRAAGTSGPRTHELSPLRLFFHRGGLYLYARIEASGHIATFAVERMVSLDVTRSPFEPPAENLERRLRRCFGVTEDRTVAVEVVFSPEVALYVRERLWHPDQVLEDLPDGGVRFRARMQGREEILAWVLSWGKSACLVRPREWRQELAGHARAMATEYAPRTRSSVVGRRRGRAAARRSAGKRAGGSV